MATAIWNGKVTAESDSRNVVQITVVLLILVSLTAAGCTATAEKRPRTSDDELSRCQRLFVTLDRAVMGAGVQDGGAARVKGFPYLRVDRFLASYRNQSMSRDETAWWVQRMQGLDAEARARTREPTGRLQDNAPAWAAEIRESNGPVESMCAFARGA